MARPTLGANDPRREEWEAAEKAAKEAVSPAPSDSEVEQQDIEPEGEE